MYVHLRPQEVRIDKQLQSGLRVTVELNKTQNQGKSVHQTITVSSVFLFSPSVSSYLYAQDAAHVHLSVPRPQRAKYFKVWWWLLMCPGQKGVSTGDTVSAWHLVSVGFLFS